MYRKPFLLSQSGEESRLPEVYAKCKLVEHTIRDIMLDLDNLLTTSRK